jgi:transposase InsO family protein
VRERRWRSPRCSCCTCVEDGRPKRSPISLELAVVEYIGWYNAARLHESLGYIAPTEYEQLHDLRERSTLVGTNV